MNILLSNDHAGVKLKNKIKKFLEKEGHSVIDYGDNSEQAVDYPDHIHPLAKEISKNKELKAIIMCGTGNGVSMVANKYQGVRAGLCWSKEIASLIRRHNDANIISIPARFVSEEETIEMIKVFLKTDFEDGGRHERRVNKINKQ
tara:strand:+ start:79 stop:513 length:435 start_codon:yes stop_codon:yes gene_type:complete